MCFTNKLESLINWPQPFLLVLSETPNIILIDKNVMNDEKLNKIENIKKLG